jgi:hypothetical protein
MVARKRSDNHHEEAHMSRIATLTAVLTMIVAPAALADGPAVHSTYGDSQPKAHAKIDLRSPDAVTPVRITAGQDLRSPDAVDAFVPPSAAPHAATVDGGGPSPWAYLAIVAAALAACALLAVMLRRAFAVGRPLGT